MIRRCLFVLVLLLVACQQAAQPTNTPPSETSIQLSWVHEYSSAPLYAAEHNGHFASQNLNVMLEEGGFGESGYIEPIDQVLDGSVDFGMASASSLIEARAQGKPVVAIMSFLQRNPNALISLAEDNIRRPQDLVGHTVAINDGGARQTYDALLISQNIDPSSVNTVSRTSYGIDPLVNGEVDVIGGWTINEGVQVQEAGLEPNIILLSDYGVDTYTFVLFTSETIINEKPDMVERMVRALVDGLEDVVADPDKAAELALLYDESLDLEGQQRRLQATIPLINPVGSQLGMMQPEVWDTTYQIMVEQGELSEPVDVESAYNLSFLEKIYQAA